MLFLTEFVRNAEAPDLDKRLVARRPDAEAFDAGAAGYHVRVRVADQVASGSRIEVDLERIAVTHPSEDIIAGRQRDAADTNRGLHHEVVRVLPIGGVAGRNEHYTRDKAAMAVDDAARC